MSAENLVPLPGGQWAKLRAPEDVSERLRRPFLRALGRVRPEVERLRATIPPLVDRFNALQADSPELESARQEVLEATYAFRSAATDDELDIYDQQNNALIVALVEKWSYEWPITIESVVDRLPWPARDALRAAVAPFGDRLFVNTEPDPLSPNSTAPGGGSPDSETPSPADQPTTSPTSSEPTSSSE